MMEYQEFLQRKSQLGTMDGFDPDERKEPGNDSE